MIPILSEVSWRSLLPGQASRLLAINPDTGRMRVILESTTSVVEAPNWSPDGRWILFNSFGSLWTVSSDGQGEPAKLDTGGRSDFNNDHVISPDGRTIYASCERDGHLYRVPASGGEAVRISPDRDGPFGYFVIGISPDGSELEVTGGETRGGRAFVSNLFRLSLPDGTLDRLTDNDFDSVGSVWSADGEWRYFNSERDAHRPGHAQVYRARANGDWHQLTHDDRVNWFPKPAPVDDRVVWLSFAPGTVGHESNVPVQLREMRSDGTGQRTLAEFVGGQGTMNVSNWSPSGAEFAFVAYPREGSPA